jgi:hypothetical protein
VFARRNSIADRTVLFIVNAPTDRSALSGNSLDRGEGKDTKKPALRRAGAVGDGSNVRLVSVWDALQNLSSSKARVKPKRGA